MVGLTIALILLSVLAHEFSHAWAMHTYGIKVTEIGLGVPIKRIPPLLKFKIKNIKYWYVSYVSIRQVVFMNHERMIMEY